MDFFDDIGSSSFGMPNPSSKKPSQQKKSNNDDFDDMLQELLIKEEKKKNKKVTIQEPSNISQKSISPPRQNLTKTDRWDFHEKIQPKRDISEINKPYQALRNRKNSRSLYEGSDDGKSNQSWFTGKESQAQANLQNLDTMKMPQRSEIQKPLGASVRGGMQPPLRNRTSSRQKPQSMIIDQKEIQQSKEDLSPSYLPEAQSLSIFPPPRPQKEIISRNDDKKNKNLVENIEKQKIVYVKEDNSKIKEEYQKQMKILKESHERQIKLLQQSLDNEQNMSKTIREKLRKEYLEDTERNRKNWEDMRRKDLQRIKQMHDWQTKKKTEGYELQIKRLKEMLELNQSIKKNINQFGTFNQSSHTLEIKEKQLLQQKNKLADLQQHLKAKERALEIQQADFENYMKREEQKLQIQRKNNFNYQIELRKQQNESKRLLAQEKIQITNQLANEQLEIMKRKERLTLEREELQAQQKFFEKQKEDYADFNHNIMNEYRKKMYELETEKQQYQERQIELYKKLHIVELMSNTRGIGFNEEQKEKYSKENDGKVGKEMNKIKETKERFEKVEQEVIQNKQHASKSYQHQKVRQYMNKIKKTNRHSFWGTPTYKV